jgi:hypothetical protein
VVISTPKVVVAVVGTTAVAELVTTMVAVVVRVTLSCLLMVQQLLEAVGVPVS